MEGVRKSKKTTTAAAYTRTVEQKRMDGLQMGQRYKIDVWKEAWYMHVSCNAIVCTEKQQCYTQSIRFEDLVGCANIFGLVKYCWARIILWTSLEFFSQNDKYTVQEKGRAQRRDEGFFSKGDWIVLIIHRSIEGETLLIVLSKAPTNN